MLRLSAILMISFFSPLHQYGQTIIAYYSVNVKSIDHYPIEKLTHIIYSFCYLKGNRINIGNAADSATIRKLVSLKKKSPSLKVMLSLGGWGGCKTCSAVFSTSEGRNTFAASVKEATSFFGTDGIDIDWEFPAVESYPGHPWSVADKDNFTALLQSLRNELGNTKEISFIAAAFSPYLQQSIDWRKVIAYVDRVNLMTYDIIGSRNKFTGHHTNLYSTSFQRESADNAVRYLDSFNVPHSKIAIGAAFYARVFVDVANLNNGLNQPGNFKRFLPLKQLRSSYTSANGYIAYWDDVAKAPYSYNPQKKIYLTYDNELSVAEKCHYILQKQLNGIMFWELRQDKPHDGLLDKIYQALHEN